MRHFNKIVLTMILFFLSTNLLFANDSLKIITDEVRHGKIIEQNLHVYLNGEKIGNSFKISRNDGYYIKDNMLSIFSNEFGDGAKNKYYRGDIFLYYKNNQILFFKDIICTYDIGYPTCQADPSLYAKKNICQKIGMNMFNQIRKNTDFVPKNKKEKLLASFLEMAKNKEIPKMKKILKPDAEYRSKPDIDSLVNTICNLVNNNEVYCIRIFQNKNLDMCQIYFPIKSDNYQLLSLIFEKNKLIFVIYSSN